MKIRNAVAATVTALALSAAPALATSAEAVAPAAHAVTAKQAAKSPTATVNAFAKTLSAANGKATCKLMTKGYQKKSISAAVKGGVVEPGASCASVMNVLGQAVKDNGGVPPYKLKIEKRTKTKAVVRLTYKDNSITGTYTTLLVGGKWLISASTVEA